MGEHENKMIVLIKMHMKTFSYKRGKNVKTKLTKYITKTHSWK